MSAPVTQKDWDRLREESRQELPEALAGADDLPAVLLPYQAQLLSTTALHQFVICEKSRRIGMTWGVGADAVLHAATARAEGGMDVLYIGYNLDMAREFIDVCAMWAKAFVGAASEVSEFLFKDQSEDGTEKDIAAFRISFASGFEIVALTSKPRSLRGRQGYVIFDEAAFHDALDELLKAAMALLMWGGKVLVISTHDGVDNPFNEKIQEVRSGKQKGKVVKVSFDDAVAAGLYERIALVKGLDASPEAKASWIADIRSFYGDDASEELDVIPKASSGAYLTGAAIDKCMSEEHHIARFTAPDGFELKPMEERNRIIDEWYDEEVVPHLNRLDPDRPFALGEDFARTMDLTVITIGQEMRGLDVVVPLIIELKNLPIAQQRRILTRVIREAPAPFQAAHLDATGNGLGLAEDMQETFGHERIEAVNISTAWYLECSPRLKERIEDQSIFFARDGDVKKDLRSAKLVRGIPRVPESRQDGRHGDAYVAFLMLLAALEAEVEIIDYRPVPPGGGADVERQFNLTGGFNSQKGLF